MKNILGEGACNENYLMHYLSSLYLVTTPLHVLGLVVCGMVRGDLDCHMPRH
jgi:hypothetical protein